MGYRVSRVVKLNRCCEIRAWTSKSYIRRWIWLLLRIMISLVKGKVGPTQLRGRWNRTFYTQILYPWSIRNLDNSLCQATAYANAIFCFMTVTSWWGRWRLKSSASRVLIQHRSSASLAFVQGIHRSPMNSPHKWPVTRKMFPFDDVIMFTPPILPLCCQHVTLLHTVGFRYESHYHKNALWYIGVTGYEHSA